MMMLSPEALAMRQTVSFAKDEGFTGIILKSNCMFVVKRVDVWLRRLKIAPFVVLSSRKLAKEFTTVSF
jgi:hypothetical protein